MNNRDTCQSCLISYAGEQLVNQAWRLPSYLKSVYNVVILDVYLLKWVLRMKFHPALFNLLTQIIRKQKSEI